MASFEALEASGTRVEAMQRAQRARELVVHRLVLDKEAKNGTAGPREWTLFTDVDALVKVAKARRFRVLVHPVPPVLNETRAIVKPFNATLQAAPIPAWSPRPRRPDAPRSPPTCSLPVLFLFSSTRFLRPRH